MKNEKQTQKQSVQDTMTDDEYYQNMFGKPLHVPNQQKLRLQRYFDPKIIPDHKNFQPIQIYEVNDQMTIKQLRNKWVKKNIKEEEIKKYESQFQQSGQFPDNEDRNKPQNYVLLWQLSFPLYEHYTMMDVKKKLQDNRFDQTAIVRVYWQWDCPFQQDQSAVNIKVFQQKHCKITIQRALRINNLKEQEDNIYFYLKFGFSSTFNDLVKEIDSYLMKNDSLIYYDTKMLKYKMFMDLKDIKENQMAVIINHYKKQGVKYTVDSDKNRLYLTASQIKVRQICAPWNIIYLDFQQPQQAKIKKDQSQFNPNVQIVCFKQNIQNNSLQESQEKQKVNLKQTQAMLDVKEKLIKKKYSQIKNVKINTILKQEHVIDPFVTSLYFENKIFRPFEYFKQIESVMKENQETIRLICVPENFLYYREIQTMQNAGYKKTMQQLLDDLIKKDKVLDQKHRKVYEQKREKKKEDEDIDLQYKHQNILDPILLYTGPHLYGNLNEYLRQTSVSLYKSEQLISKSWHYPFCQKLTKSLLKLKNYQGKVWRGSIDFAYSYKQGQIVEWNCFNSTATKLQIAMKFIIRKLDAQFRYLFQIQTYSGKEIHQFSYYGKEHEVMILPYTRFRVIKVTQNYIINPEDPKFPDQFKIPVTHVLLEQLPIPKQIPGNIVVWIDANIDENSKTFNKIVKKNQLEDFDLIQVVSNEQFKDWLNEYKNLLSLPEARIHFISNLNRPPHFSKQGMQTLRIIRSFRPESFVVFYIGNIQNTWNAIRQTEYAQDKNIQVVRTIKALNQVFVTKLAKKSE